MEVNHVISEDATNTLLEPSEKTQLAIYDQFDNILCQIDGYKEILLFPPSEDKYLHLDIKRNIL